MRSGRIGVCPRYTVPPRAVVCRTQSSQPLMLGRPLMISGMDSISVSAVLVMGGIQESKNFIGNRQASPMGLLFLDSLGFLDSWIPVRLIGHWLQMSQVYL